MSRPTARLEPLPLGGLPAWCDRYLAPDGEGEFFASRAWYDTLIAHALPAGAEPLLAVCGDDAAVLLPLMRQGGRLSALVSPYSLDWRPLCLPGAGAEAVRAAGRALGRRLRLGAPVRLDMLDPAAPGLEPLLEGVRAAGLRPLRYLHVGNWHEELAAGLDWAGYLRARPPELRSTVTRKLARAVKEATFEVVAAPGPALEAGIAAYVAVRAQSWKPDEPFPDFDAVLLRVAAGRGLLRLGLLRRKADGAPLAAQYWILDHGGRRATVLKLSHVQAERAASPGTVLTALMIRRLLEMDGVSTLDFGRGDDPYKQLWAGTRRQRIGVLLADPLHPAGALDCLRQAISKWRRRLAAG